MQPSPTRGFGEGANPHPFEEFSEYEGRLGRIRKQPRGRVEIKGQPVGLVERTDLTVHDMNRDATEVDESHDGLF